MGKKKDLMHGNILQAGLVEKRSFTMKKTVSFLTAGILFLLLTSCLNGPAIREVYKNNEKRAGQKGKILIYKILADGDNYDSLIQSIVLDMVKLHFKRKNYTVIINEDVFVNEHKDRPFKIEEDYSTSDYEHILTFHIKVKSIGFSMAKLKQEWNLFLNMSLYNKKGDLRFSSVSTKTTSYNLNSGKRFHYDLEQILLRTGHFVEYYRLSHISK